MEDPTLGSSLAVVLPSAVGWLISLRNLRACSLPSCIPPPPEVCVPTSSHHNYPNVSNNLTSQTVNNSNQISTTQINNLVHQSATPIFTSTLAACKLLNRALVSLRHLQRLGLARCHLTGQLKTLLYGLSQPLEYLNLQVSL